MLDKIIKKVGLDRVAHFGVGGVIGAAFAVAFLYSLPMADGVLKLSWWNIQVPFVLGYAVVFLVALAKEFVFDAAPDKWDFLASILGVVPVHLAGVAGWLLHLCNGHDLITATCGWVGFGILFATAAFFWIRWAVKFKNDR